MKKLLKEPLLHFLLIGAAFFLLFSLVNTPESGEQTIVIDESDLDEIVAKFETQWKRSPTEDELVSILNKKIDEEIFYQEALKLNLDHNDEIIKRRLSQKMQFLSKDIASVVEPTDEQLKTFYNAHIDNYMIEAHYTLYQIFFSPDERDDWRNDARVAAQTANTLPIEQALELGDAISLPGYFEHTSAFHITRQMGEDFTNAIAELPVGLWQGPVESGYGAHVVFIVDKTDARPAVFGDVKNDVLEDFQYQNQQEIEKALLNEYRNAYQLTIDVQSENYRDAFIEELSDKLGFK